MADVSILLPSLRCDAVRRVVTRFSETNPTCDYEIVVVSPFKVEDNRVVHVEERQRRGVIHAANQAYAVASADHVVVWSDDALPELNCLQKMLAFVKAHDAPFIGSFSRRGPDGKEAEQWSVYGRLYAGWLCASRRTIDAMGGLFDPAYKNYWADPDLSMRVWANGGQIDVCRDAWIRVSQIDDNVKSDNLTSSFDADTNVFFDRWHSEYGGSTKRVWTAINIPIPCSLEGRIRARLRRIPYLRTLYAKARLAFAASTTSSHR